MGKFNKVLFLSLLSASLIGGSLALTNIENKQLHAANSLDTNTYTKITTKNKNSLSAGDDVVLYCDASGVGVTGYEDSDATVTSTPDEMLKFKVNSISSDETKYSLKHPTTSKYIDYVTKNKFTISSAKETFMLFDDAGYLTFKDGQSSQRYLTKNSNNYRCYTSIGSYKPFYVYKYSSLPAVGIEQGETLTVTDKEGAAYSLTTSVSNIANPVYSWTADGNSIKVNDSSAANPNLVLQYTTDTKELITGMTILTVTVTDSKDSTINVSASIRVDVQKYGVSKLEWNWPNQTKYLYENDIVTIPGELNVTFTDSPDPIKVTIDDENLSVLINGDEVDKYSYKMKLADNTLEIKYLDKVTDPITFKTISRKMDVDTANALLNTDADVYGEFEITGRVSKTGQKGTLSQASEGTDLAKIDLNGYKGTEAYDTYNIRLGDLLTVKGTLKKNNYGNNNIKDYQIINHTPKTVVVKELKIKTQPTVKEFALYSTFNYKGLELLVIDQFGDEITLTEGFTVSAVDTTKIGKQNVTVSYSGKTVNYEINVTGKPAYESLVNVNKDSLGLKKQYVKGNKTINKIEFSYVNLACYDDKSIQFQNKSATYLKNATPLTQSYLLKLDFLQGKSLKCAIGDNSDLSDSTEDVVLDSDNNTLLVNKKYFKLFINSSASNLVSLKLEKPSLPDYTAEQHAVAFAKYFLNTLQQDGYCSADGLTPDANLKNIKNVWPELALEYSYMSSDAKNLFATSKDTLDAVTIYKMIMKKYSNDYSLENFAVDGSGNLIFKANEFVNSLNTSDEMTSTILISVSLLFVVAATALIFINKRRKLED